MIIKNAIRCNICGDEIESKHRHDYVECKCGACAVDGGHDNLRRCAQDEKQISRKTQLRRTCSRSVNTASSTMASPRRT